MDMPKTKDIGKVGIINIIQVNVEVLRTTYVI